jgi:hypothetical protein
MRALWVSLCLLIALPARALDVDGTFRLLNRFNAQKDAVQTFLVYDEATRRFRVQEYLLPTLDHLFSTHLIGGFLDVSFGKGWSFTASVDSGLLRVGEENLTRDVIVGLGPRRVREAVTVGATEVRLSANGMPLTDEAGRSLFLRESYFTYASAGWLHAWVGKRRVVFGDGWIYDQFAFGAGLHLDASHGVHRAPWRVELQVVLADGSFDTGGKQSPLVQLGAYYVPGAFQHFGLNVVYFHDGNNLLSQVLRTALNEGTIDRAQTMGTTGNPALALQVPLDSGGDLLWFGLSGKRFLGDHTVQGRLMGQAGAVNASVVFPFAGPGGTPLVRTITPRALGLLADFVYQYDFTEDLVAGAFFTFATGDDEISASFRRAENKGTIDAFLSVFPFVTRTNLFFNGGLNAEFTLRQAATIGVNARGLLVGGAFLRYDHNHFIVEAKVAALGAHRASIYEGRYYGTEADLTFQAPLARGVRLVAETDALFTGDFFARERTSLQFILGIDIAVP